MPFFNAISNSERESKPEQSLSLQTKNEKQSQAETDHANHQKSFKTTDGAADHVREVGLTNLLAMRGKNGMERRRFFSVVENAHGGDLQQMKDIINNARVKQQKIGKKSDGNSDPQNSQEQKSGRKQNKSHSENSN